MQLKRVELENFCQHRDERLEFVPGLNFIVGPNGCGKSNAMKAVFGSLTGDFRSRNEGNTADNICQLAQGAPALVRTHFTHGDTVMTVVRTLHRDGKTHARLVVQSAGTTEVYAKATEVNDKIMSILGVSPKMLSDYVFVDQWSVFAFLDATAGDRAKAFQRLFGTEKAEHIYQMAGKRLAALSIPVSGIDLDEAGKDVENCQLYVGKLLATLKFYKDVPDEYDPEQDPDRKILQRYETHGRLLQEADDYQRRAQAMEVKVDELQKEHDVEATDLGSIQYYLREERKEVDKARRQLDNWNTYMQVSAAARRYNEEITAARKELLRIGKQPEPSKDVIHTSEWHTVRKRLGELAIERSRLLGRIAAVKEGDCPTCGQSTVDLLHEPVEEAEKKVRDLDNTIDKVQGQLVLSEVYEKEVAGWKIVFERAYARLTGAQEGLVRLPQVERPDKDETGLRRYLQQIDKMHETVDSLTTALNEKERQLASYKSAREVAQVEEANRRKEAEAVYVSKWEREAVLQRLKERTEQFVAKKEFKVALSAAQARLQQAQKVVDDVLAVQTRADVLRAWQGRLEAIRGAFHREAAPKIAAHNYLELIQVEVNELLERFDGDFRVDADDGLSFTARFVKGPKVGAVQPAGRLSGGEKVLLGVSFRVAVNSMFASDLGLLVLDEPTAGLDKGNLACLQVAFERLRELSRSRGLQVVMITHEENLPAADNVIEIGVNRE
jgi:DNA repair exonuclease SbcCD ATPase subunit